MGPDSGRPMTHLRGFSGPLPSKHGVDRERATLGEDLAAFNTGRLRSTRSHEPGDTPPVLWNEDQPTPVQTSNRRGDDCPDFRD